LRAAAKLHLTTIEQVLDFDLWTAKSEHLFKTGSEDKDKAMLKVSFRKIEFGK